MSPNSSKIEKQALALALDLAASVDAQISGFALADHFANQAKFLNSRGVLVPKGSVETIAADDDVPVSVEWSSRNQGYGFFSEADGWVALENQQVTMHALQCEALIGLLTRQMDINPRKMCFELVPGLLWELGSCRLPGRAKRVAVWAARRLHDRGVWPVFDKIQRDRPTQEVRLVLNLAENEDHSLPYVGNHCIISVGSVLSLIHPFEIDPDIVAARLRFPPDNAGTIPVSADGGHVRANGKNFVFRGSKHRAIVRFLFDAKCRGEMRSSTEQVLYEAGSSDKTRRLSRAFSGHKDWQEIIKEEAGTCWLEI